jgi:AraC-like DNA-binding protein
MLIGQMLQPVFVLPSGRVDLVGVRFKPAGAMSFFPAPPIEWSGQLLALEDVTPGWRQSLSESVGAASTHPDRIRILETFLLAQLETSNRADPAIEYIAERIDKSRGEARISDLARAAGLSHRQLERRFERAVGIGPKLFSRLIRFQHVFQAVEHNPGGWAAVAVECGYYDQSHLLKDFRQFAGATPLVVLEQSQELTRLFLKKNARMTNFSKTAD